MIAIPESGKLLSLCGVLPPEKIGVELEVKGGMEGRRWCRSASLSGAFCPPKPHPRSLSTAWRGRAQRSTLLDFAKSAHLGSPSPLVEKGTGDEASKGRTPQRAKRYCCPDAHPSRPPRPHLHPPP